MIFLSQTAFASEKTDYIISPDAQLDAVEVHDDDNQGDPNARDHDKIPDVSIDQDVDWSQDESEEETYENPGMHDGYYNEVGGARFYTEHDINQWLKPDEDSWGVIDFDIEQMLTDLWCQDGGEIHTDNWGYFCVIDGDLAKGVWFDMPDSINDNMFHEVNVIYNDEGTQYVTHIQIRECPPMTANYKGDFYLILDHYRYVAYKDLAPLILLAIEEMDVNLQCSVLNDLDLNDNFYCD